MPLTDDEKQRVRYHLGYPAVTSTASVQFGVPAFSQQLFMVENNLTKLLENAVEQVRRISMLMDNIEHKLIDAQDRLAATRLEDLELRADETDSLEGEYRRWGYRLAELVGCPVYLYSERYKAGGANRVTNVTVRG